MRPSDNSDPLPSMIAYAIEKEKPFIAALVSPNTHTVYQNHARMSIPSAPRYQSRRAEPNRPRLSRALPPGAARMLLRHLREQRRVLGHAGALYGPVYVLGGALYSVYIQEDNSRPHRELRDVALAEQSDNATAHLALVHAATFALLGISTATGRSCAASHSMNSSSSRGLSIAARLQPMVW